MKTEFLQNFKVGDQALPKEIIDAILAENGRDIEAAKKAFAAMNPSRSSSEPLRFQFTLPVWGATQIIFFIRLLA